MKQKIIIVSSLLLVLSLVIRLIGISRIPLSLNWDEATFIYNAYSILQTGKDEYGQILPLQFKSIGDYKNPMYVYLLVPSISIFGLNETATRLPPAILGALSVVILFILVYSLFGNLKLATISGIVLAISPWHIQFTRAGADVGVSSFFVILGICLFFRRRLTLSLAAFVGSAYSYYADKFFSPLIILTLIIFFYKDLFRNSGAFLRALIIATLLILPILSLQFSPGHINKVSITTLLSYRFPEDVLNKLRQQDGNLLFTVFHNPVIEYGSLVLDRYLNHFSPSFLFIKGLEDNRQRLESMGMLYWSDAIFLTVALCTLNKWKSRKYLLFILIWLVLAPLPSAITRSPVHARRAINMIYPLSILIAMGITQIKRTGWLIAGPIVVWSMGLYFISYVILTPLKTYQGSAGWQYGYKQLVNFITPIAGNYDHIVVDTGFQGPYIYFLFYQKYLPVKYQLQANLFFSDPTGLGESIGFDNYSFREIFWPGDRGTKNTLFAATLEKIPLKDIDPKQAKLLGTIYFPDGKEAWRIVATSR